MTGLVDLYTFQFQPYTCYSTQESPMEAFGIIGTR